MTVDAKVLVVDDTDHVRDMLVTMLELDGFTVVGQAQSGEDAIQLAPTKRPDVIVMDHKMPGMDGLEAARRIREEIPGQAIILYTAYLDDKLEATAKEAGIAICVAKVEGVSHLERHIRELCSDIADWTQEILF
ncbi:MAG: response regulator transcription factor [Actinomycetota bacterium]|nr:response regulator transcription factor [Actinomycetota bacterium]